MSEIYCQMGEHMFFNANLGELPYLFNAAGYIGRHLTECGDHE